MTACATCEGKTVTYDGGEIDCSRCDFPQWECTCTQANPISIERFWPERHREPRSHDRPFDTRICYHCDKTLDFCRCIFYDPMM